VSVTRAIGALLEVRGRLRAAHPSGLHGVPDAASSEPALKAPSSAGDTYFNFAASDEVEQVSNFSDSPTNWVASHIRAKRDAL
jgi:hypothetical protein